MLDQELFGFGEEGQYLRRLPLYLLLDTSKSMNLNHAIDGLRRGVGMLVNVLRGIPEARGTVHIKVIEFSDQVTATPLVRLLDFRPPRLEEAKGEATFLGMALRRLDSDARFGHDLIANRTDTGEARKGDLTPVVLILTDGQPNDPRGEFESAADVIKRRVEHRQMSVTAIACGQLAPPATLARITDSVFVMDTLTAERIESVMSWFSQSVAVYSRSLSRDPRAQTQFRNIMESLPIGITPWSVEF